jgi:1-acyl-sn-glycerol-3-phosphate acyltransferase
MRSEQVAEGSEFDPADPASSRRCRNRDEGDPETEAEDLLSGALLDLRQEISSRFDSQTALGEAGDREPASWVALVEELRLRVPSLWMAERSGAVDDFGLDEQTLRHARPVLEYLRNHYWRVDVAGIEQLPTESPVLLVANRSGILPYDGLMVSHLVADSLSEARRPRFLVADWLITLPFVQPYLARLGGVRACRENADRLLRTGRSVVAFPEGLKGAGKVFRQRYRLKRFGRGGVVRVAIEVGIPLVPVAVIGAEEAHPVLFKMETLARSVGAPFIPVTPTFPLLGPLGLIPLPSKWSIRFGAPIETEHLGASEARDELLVSRMTEELRSEIQTMVDADLHARESVWG